MKRALGIVTLVLLALLSVVLLRTLQCASRQVPVEPVQLARVDPQQIAGRLAGALRLRTVSQQDPAAVNREEFRALHRYLAEQFPTVHARLQREVVGDSSLLYTWKGSEPARKPVVLLSHLDVVPVEPGTEEKWTYSAFDGRIADGYIWGRGALDDKLGVLGILEATERLLQDGFQPRTTLYFAFGQDEEQGGDNGAARIDGLLHSRGVEAEYVLDEGGAILRGLVPGLAAPLAAVGIAEKGSVSLELSVQAPGGHSSSPPSSTAVGIVSAAVHNVEEHQMPVALTGASRAFFDYVGPELPFPYRLVFANLWLFGGVVERQLVAMPATNATVRTTTAATMIEGGVKENVLPASARAVVNFRILPGDSVQSVTEHVRRVVNDPRVEIRALPGVREPSRESPIDSASFALLQRTIREVFPGVVVAPYLTIGGTDSRHYMDLTKNVYRFTPIIVDPSDLLRMHGVNERLSVDNYAQVVQFFIQLIKNSGAPAQPQGGGVATGRRWLSATTIPAGRS
jgi:carboxypeptidase PM20D1